MDVFFDSTEDINFLDFFTRKCFFRKYSERLTLESKGQVFAGLTEMNICPMQDGYSNR